MYMYNGCFRTPFPLTLCTSTGWASRLSWSFSSPLGVTRLNDSKARFLCACRGQVVSADAF